MYALFVSNQEMYLCRDNYSSWISRCSPTRKQRPCSCRLLYFGLGLPTQASPESRKLCEAIEAEQLSLCFISWLRNWSSNPAIGVRLRRGYEAPAPGAVEVDAKAEEADNFAARVPVNRLVFVVHGIGQVDCHAPVLSALL